MSNWNLADKYTLSGISADVYFSKKALIKDCYDIGIFFSSFESRCLISSNLLARNSLTDSLVVFFNEEKETELRKRHDPFLVQQVSECCKNEPIIINDISIKDVDNVLRKALSNIPPKFWASNARWFMDIGGAPVPYFLGLIAYLRDSFPCPKLTIFNPTADYGDKGTHEYSFTKGYNTITWVPRLWGRPDPSLLRTFVFLLGFEGERSYDVFYRCEPDLVKAVIANPGYKDEYVDIPVSRNARFLEEAGLLERNSNTLHNVIYAHASNPVDIWKKLESLVQAEQGKSNIVFIPLGPKAHAIGAGLCALGNGIPSVLYHKPNTYIVRDVKAGQYLWKYDITL